jgi:hypothetical protein
MGREGAIMGKLNPEFKAALIEYAAQGEVARAKITHLETMLEEAEKTIIALVRDRDFYRDELSRKGGNN